MDTFTSEKKYKKTNTNAKAKKQNKTKQNKQTLMLGLLWCNKAKAREANK
jgi:hypothetical protein